MLLLNLDRNADEPLFSQIITQLKKMIQKGVLVSGEELPSSRALAAHLGVNRTTIYRAYEELWAQGYIDSHTGARSVVRNRFSPPEEVEGQSHATVDWSIQRNEGCNRGLSRLKSQEIVNDAASKYNFLPLAPDPDFMPVQAFRKSLNFVLNREGNTLLGYGDPHGNLSLREFIASQMRQHCMTISVDEILLTNGSQGSLDLLLRLFIEPGDTIVVEAPTYSAAIPLFEAYGARLVSIGVEPDGMNLDRLEAVLKTDKPKLVYSMPNFQNPTGITTCQAHRERLLSLCADHKVALVEDGFEEDMKYFGKAVLPVKSMDRQGIVFYLGTFSKILFPGLRVGWIAASIAAIDDLTALKKISSISSNSLNEAALAHFCGQGHYERHVKRAHRIYRRRMQAALKALREYLPAEYGAVREPRGGYTIWIELKGCNLDEGGIIEALSEAGVSVTPGRISFVETQESASFRLSISMLEAVEITEGIRIIGNTLRDLAIKHRPPAALNAAPNSGKPDD